MSDGRDVPSRSDLSGKVRVASVFSSPYSEHGTVKRPYFMQGFVR